MSNILTKQSDRLYSLDALRGFDMFWIMGGEDDKMNRIIWFYSKGNEKYPDIK